MRCYGLVSIRLMTSPSAAVKAGSYRVINQQRIQGQFQRFY